jgi:hypothetical protein
MGSSIVSALRSGDTGPLSGLLADDAVFSSPVIEEIAPGQEWVREWAGERDCVYTFTAQVSGEQVQGLMREQRGSAGTLTHVTLFLRPYSVLRTAIAKMSRLMTDSPLPQSE